MDNNKVIHKVMTTGNVSIQMKKLALYLGCFDHLVKKKPNG